MAWLRATLLSIRPVDRSPPAPLSALRGPPSPFSHFFHPPRRGISGLVDGQRDLVVHRTKPLIEPVCLLSDTLFHGIVGKRSASIIPRFTRFSAGSRRRCKRTRVGALDRSSLSPFPYRPVFPTSVFLLCRSRAEFSRAALRDVSFESLNSVSRLK